MVLDLWERRSFHFILDERGEPVPTDDRDAAARLLLDPEKRRVALTRFVFRGIAVEVSTVFLVFNHAYFDGPPVLWETMIFARDRCLNNYQRRYTSRVAAIVGHALTVEVARRMVRRRRANSRRVMVAQRRVAAGQDVLRRRG